LPLLEVLCSVDETVVREQAVKSLSKIADSLSATDMQNVFAQMVIRLSTTESLPSRVSSIGLLTPCYKRAGNQKEKLRKYHLNYLKTTKIGGLLNCAKKKPL
jgi:serine/threonine-protein phosphatase 2A regulatory subunit A